MALTAAQAFKQLVDRTGGSLTKRHFLRRGMTLFRIQDENWGLIGFQKSQKTSADTVLFTVNLGVVSSRLARFFSLPLSQVQPPGPSSWHWRERLGSLLPENQDRWWELRTGADWHQLETEIEDALVRLALPAIEAHVQDESLRDLWLTGRSPGLTDVQRLKNLIVLLKTMGPEHRLAPTLDELGRMSKPSVAFIQAQFQREAGV